MAILARTCSLRLLNRAVLPVAKYRMPRWSYQTQAAKQLDRTQTKMIGILLGMRFQSGDDPASFARRRRHAAAKIATEIGRWSGAWRKSVVNWNAHLHRSINHKSWAYKTLQYHGKHWLREQRRIHAVGQWGSVLAGRTRTGAMPGMVHKR